MYVCLELYPRFMYGCMYVNKYSMYYVCMSFPQMRHCNIAPLHIQYVCMYYMSYWCLFVLYFSRWCTYFQGRNLGRHTYACMYVCTYCMYWRAFVKVEHHLKERSMKRVPGRAALRTGERFRFWMGRRSRGRRLGRRWACGSRTENSCAPKSPCWSPESLP